MLAVPHGLRPTSKLFVLVIFIFTYPSGWPKYCKTLKNIRRYYTLKCVQDIYRCVFILARFNKNVLQLNAKKAYWSYAHIIILKRPVTPSVFFL